MNTDSESVQVTKKIVEAMDEEVREDGGEFSLIILPSIWDINFYSSDPDFKKKWNEMVFEICSARINCLDLMKDFQKIPVESFDTGYDGTHYGPKTNSLIADFIRQKALH
jgi:hypothetical protein